MPIGVFCSTGAKASVRFRPGAGMRPPRPASIRLSTGAASSRTPNLFDAAFFGVSPREAIAMDPQHRIVLELGWHALENANIAPTSLRNSATGVFLGISGSDYAHLTGASEIQSDRYRLPGSGLSFAPGRLAHFLGLQGPSMAIDAACSSSLVAVHLACRSLRAQESDLCLAGGVNLIAAPGGTAIAAQFGMIARDGRCKTFDAAADGFVRAEGGGLVVLKRLADASRDGDRVFAVIAGSAVNQDGPSSGLTVPNGGGPATGHSIRIARCRPHTKRHLLCGVARDRHGAR